MSANSKSDRKFLIAGGVFFCVAVISHLSAYATGPNRWLAAAESLSMVLGVAMVSYVLILDFFKKKT